MTPDQDAATVAGAVLGAVVAANGANGSTTSQPPRPTAAERAAAQVAKRFGAGRTQPPTDGRPPRVRTGQAAQQLARRYPGAGTR